jgi:hypothetical protein
VEEVGNVSSKRNGVIRYRSFCHLRAIIIRRNNDPDVPRAINIRSANGPPTATVLTITNDDDPNVHRAIIIRSGNVFPQ